MAENFWQVPIRQMFETLIQPPEPVLINPTVIIRGWLSTYPNTLAAWLLNIVNSCTNLPFPYLSLEVQVVSDVNLVYFKLPSWSVWFRSTIIQQLDLSNRINIYIQYNYTVPLPRVSKDHTYRIAPKQYIANGTYIRMFYSMQRIMV